MHNEQEDLDISEILEDLEKKPKEEKKKVDGKGKGDRTELNLCKLFTKHFGKEREFSRGYGSGNRWSQVGHMPQHAKDTFLGDICCPEGFRWVIESKGGYEDDLKLDNIFGPIALLDKDWIPGAERDSELSGRTPIICWKRNRKPWLAFVRAKDIKSKDTNKFDYYIRYRDWRIFQLKDMLDYYPEEFWFGEKE